MNKKILKYYVLVSTILVSIILLEYNIIEYTILHKKLQIICHSFVNIKYFCYIIIFLTLTSEIKRILNF